jgi:hypothetical protein
MILERAFLMKNTLKKKFKNTLQNSFQMIALSALLMSACADATDGTSGDPSANQASPQAGICEPGKCDGVVSTIKNYYSDMRSLNLDDLTQIGAKLATKEINQALSSMPYANLQLSPTSFYGMQKRQVFNEVMVEDINQLQTALTQRLGEESFISLVNRLRVNTLNRLSDAVFAESSFKISSTFQHNWSLASGDSILGELGFIANPSLEAQVIAPYQDQVEAVWQNPLSTMYVAKGFILPTSDEDLLALEPGTSIALRGSGSIGFNLGVGQPLIATAVGDFLTLSAKLSAGARVSLSGDLDVQVIRGEGTDVYLEVGMGNQKLKHFSVALTSGWGIEGLPNFELNLGIAKANLTDIVTKALQKQLNDRLSLFDAQANGGTQSGRFSVARFKFDLSKAGEALSQAIKQGLRGDIRLAQALANRPNSGVEQLLDLSKNYESESSYLGFRFLSMRFFSQEAQDQGMIQISQDGENQTLLFEEIDERGGFFFTERGAKWRQLTSLKTSQNQIVSSQNNARLVILESDRFLSKDQMLDHVDALLIYFMGFDGLYEAVGPSADMLFTWVDDVCTYPTSNGRNAGNDAQLRAEYEECVANISNLPPFSDLPNASRLAAEAFLNHWIDFDFAYEFTSASEVSKQLLALKLGLSGIHEPSNVALTGPKGTLVSEIRFSQQAIDQLMALDAPIKFEQALQQVLTMMRSDRTLGMNEKRSKMQSFISSKSSAIKNISKVYQQIVNQYEQYERISNLKFLDQSQIGDEAQLLLVPQKDPSKAQIAPIAVLKGNLIGQLFTQIVNASSGLREPDQFLMGYALLMLTNPSQIEMLVNYHFDESDEDAIPYQKWNTSIYSRGIGSVIDAGRFNLESLLGAR